MSLVLYHHPWSRAAGVVWMLEELGEPYELRYVDMRAGEHQDEAHRARNRMMKVPVLEDGEVTVSETAAIGVYLADRHALGRLAPALDDPARGAYLRWCFYAPSVLEMACMAKSSGWEYSPGQAGFGSYDNVVATLEEALAPGPWLLGERFTMADAILGGTVRWMLRFDMLERGDQIGAYADRLGERPANQRATAINDAIVKERGLTPG
ncbi:MAG: glutathione S-transferase family protein [Nannocystaceae bacterium]